MIVRAPKAQPSLPREYRALILTAAFGVVEPPLEHVTLALF